MLYSWALPICFSRNFWLRFWQLWVYDRKTTNSSSFLPKLLVRTLIPISQSSGLPKAVVSWHSGSRQVRIGKKCLSYDVVQHIISLYVVESCIFAAVLSLPHKFYKSLNFVFLHENKVIYCRGGQKGIILFQVLFSSLDKLSPNRATRT